VRLRSRRIPNVDRYAPDEPAKAFLHEAVGAELEAFADMLRRS
jgi:hypothetical protein